MQEMEQHLKVAVTAERSWSTGAENSGDKDQALTRLLKNENGGGETGHRAFGDIQELGRTDVRGMVGVQPRGDDGAGHVNRVT